MINFLTVRVLTHLYFLEAQLPFVFHIMLWDVKAEAHRGQVIFPRSHRTEYWSLLFSGIPEYEL